MQARGRLIRLACQKLTTDNLRRTMERESHRLWSIVFGPVLNLKAARASFAVKLMPPLIRSQA
jgi:hypothetical protein